MENKNAEPTRIQADIFNFIKKRQAERGFPPSIQEIGKAVGLSSSSSVHHQLSNLERLGLIKRDKTKSRSIEILQKPQEPPVTSVQEVSPGETGHDGKENAAAGEIMEPSGTAEDTAAPAETQVLPALERFHDYMLVTFNAESSSADGGMVMGTMTLPVDLIGYKEAFLLEMQGDSMKQVGIHDRDICIIKQNYTPADGDIIAVKVDKEIMIRRFFNGPGYFVLEAENTRYKPVMVVEALFLGKVIGLFRNEERL